MTETESAPPASYTAEQARITELVRRWPQAIEEAVSRTREAENILHELMNGLGDEELFETTEADEAGKALKDAWNALYDALPVARKRLMTQEHAERGAEIARLRACVSELEARLADGPSYVPREGDRIVFPLAPRDTDRLPVHVVAGVDEDGKSFTCRWHGIDGPVQGRFHVGDAKNLGARLATEDEINAEQEAGE